MAKRRDQQPLVHGETAPAFDRVRSLFEHNMRTLAEENAQLCVYHKGRKVVDLWATHPDTPQFSGDSLVNIFSSGKSLESIAIASLVGKGLLDYEAPVVKYWPAFAGGGKESVLVADLMRHEAGLVNFSRSINTTDLLTPNIKQNRVGEIIEQESQRFASGGTSRREYHAMTRGWIANELYRRVDPAGRTIGEYLREDLSDALGVDIFIGLEEAQLEQVAPVRLLDPKTHIFESLKPRLLGRRVQHNLFQLIARVWRPLWAMRKSRSAGAPPAPVEGMRNVDIFNEAGMMRGETPSANTHANARSLAKVAAIMASGGELEGDRCLDKMGWSALHDHPVPAEMGNFMPTRFTQGGVDRFLPITDQSSMLEKAFNGGREGFYGWMGLGGSIFQWHPEHEIGLAFVPTSLHLLDLLNERGKFYQAEVLRCIDAA